MLCVENYRSSTEKTSKLSRKTIDTKRKVADLGRKSETKLDGSIVEAGRKFYRSWAEKITQKEQILKWLAFTKAFSLLYCFVF